MPEPKQRALESLKLMTSEEIKKGLPAFDVQPHGSAVDCFCTQAFGLSAKGKWRPSNERVQPADLSFCYEVSPNNRCAKNGDSLVLNMLDHYGDLNSWLKSECIRELAERGETVEPLAAVDKTDQMYYIVGSEQA
jgi:hypothetical protein